MPRAWLDYFTTTAQIAQTALRLRQPPQMSFRGVKRRGNPLNRNATQWRLPLTALVLAITTAQKIFAIKIRRIRNRTAVSQDCLLVGRAFGASG